MKKAEQDYKSLLVQYKETKCEIEMLNGELTEAYSKIKFIELEVIQANAKVIAHQKPFSNRSGLRYTRESSSVVNISKEMKFVKAKEPVVQTSVVEKVKPKKKRNVTDQRFLTKPPNQSVVKPMGKGKSLPKSQRGSRTQHFCHSYGIPGHIRPNCHKLQALKNSNAQRSRHGKGNWTTEQSKGQEGNLRVGDVLKMIDAFTTCLASFTKRFESHNDRTQSSRDITPNASVIWVKKGTHA